MAEPTTYTVTFKDGRVGRNHDVPPFTTTAADADDLADKVFDHVDSMLLSRDVSVALGLDTLTGAIYCGVRNGGTFTISAPLTFQERRVAGLASRRVGNRQIAVQLHITVSTVEQHLTRAYRKTGTKRAGLREWLDANPVVPS